MTKADLQKKILDYIKQSEGVGAKGRYGYQCVTSVVDCWQKVFNTPKDYKIVGAKNFWLWYEQIPTLKSNFERVVVSEFELGDAVVWDWGIRDPNSLMSYGHTAIFLRWTNDEKTEFEVLQQDGAEQLPAYRKTWPVTNHILGGLRHRSIIAAPVEEPQSPVEPADAPSNTQQVEEPIIIAKTAPAQPEGADWGDSARAAGKFAAGETRQWLKNKKSKEKDEGERIMKRYGWSTLLNTKLHLFALNLEDTHPWLEEYVWMFALLIAGGIWGVAWLIGKLSFSNYLNIRVAIEEGRKPNFASILVQRALGCRKKAEKSARDSGDYRFYDLIYGDSQD